MSWIERHSNRPIDFSAAAQNLALARDAVRSLQASDDVISFRPSDWSTFRNELPTAPIRSHTSRQTQDPVKLSAPPSDDKQARENKTCTQRSQRLEPRVVALASIIKPIARRYQVDHALLMAIIHVESHGNPQAISYRGAMGLMQIMPRTGAYYGARDLFDKQQNITAGARYLRALTIRHGGHTDLVIAAYNAGSGTIIKHGGRIPPYPETQRYVHKVASYRAAYCALPG
ncbi:lytic transglycosylase domain-containing protein [Burkholderia pyrrocinia]|uniref:lytic transglycosylase domain-containing protein n=1 Tax=Burkholderia pyrrocinia TaxID=60550 RepID=UPI00158C43FF|nr:lytic transglycosylase domain-containing protein [Burkholderia pyrrocinia]